MNSKQKGNRFEREVAKQMTEAGFAAMRGQQRAGTEEQDIVCPVLNDQLDFWFECKGVKTGYAVVYEHYQQAVRDADLNYPVLIFRQLGDQKPGKPARPTMAAMSLGHFLLLCRKLIGYQEALRIATAKNRQLEQRIEALERK